MTGGYLRADGNGARHRRRRAREAATPTASPRFPATAPSRRLRAAARGCRDPDLSRGLRRPRRWALSRCALSRRPSLPGLCGRSLRRARSLPRFLHGVSARCAGGVPPACRFRLVALQRRLQGADGALRARDAAAPGVAARAAGRLDDAPYRCGAVVRPVTDRARADLAQHLRRLARASDRRRAGAVRSPAEARRHSRCSAPRSRRRSIPSSSFRRR